MVPPYYYIGHTVGGTSSRSAHDAEKRDAVVLPARQKLLKYLKHPLQRRNASPLCQVRTTAPPQRSARQLVRCSTFLTEACDVQSTQAMNEYCSPAETKHGGDERAQQHA
jgi:hypothetical protein